MSPEYIKGTNIIKLLPRERICGQGGEIRATKENARLQIEFLTDMIHIKNGGKDIYISGESYQDVLQKIIEDSQV